jgi:hypothetical protein
MPHPSTRLTAAELRAERHARTFTPRQLPAVDQRVVLLAAQKYNALQIASLLRVPVMDVRLSLSMHAKGSTQTITTTHARKT